MWAEGSRIALLASGSFNPPTFVHLRMLELARDHLERVAKCQVIEGILSPVSDAYGKKSLVSGFHRLNMCRAACSSSSWIKVESWETDQPHWTRTLVVLRHHRDRLRKEYGDDVNVALVVGSDVAKTFSLRTLDGRPIWDQNDLKEIFTKFGLVVIQRSDEFNPKESIEGTVRECAKDMQVITEDVFPNQISSTRLRDAVCQGRSIKYATFDSVIDYIEEHQLYKKPPEEPTPWNGDVLPMGAAVGLVKI